MMRRLLAASCILVLSALAHADPQAAATDTSAAAAAQAAPEAAAGDKMVCKKVKTTGSHFKRRVCQKQSVWRAQREASQEEHRRMLSRPSTGTPG